MKRFLRGLGAVLMGFNGIAVIAVILNAPAMIKGMDGKSFDNLPVVLCMVAVYGALGFLGYRLYKRGTDGMEKPAKPAIAKPTPAPVESASMKPTAPVEPAPAQGQAEGATADGDPEETLSDIAYVREIRHGMCGPWHQYDVLLDARPYGWAMMVDWAAYMDGADLAPLGTVSVADLGSGDRELIDSYRAHDGQLQLMPELEAERGMLGIGGSSKVLRDLVKIVWINQTRTLRLFTTQDHGARIEPYVETVVRRTFGTPDAMKRGKKRPPNGPNQNP